MKRYKVIQWATGVVGKNALKGIIQHPKLDLVGVKVYSDEKDGLDAGDIINMEKTGVLATKDVDAIIALDADCVIYCPMPWDVAEMCRLLESGKHMVTPVPYIFPFKQDPESTKQFQAACKKGKVNFHGTGTNPGGIAERFPLTFTGWCNRVDRITTTEYGDCREYSSVGVIRMLMNLGATPEEADNNPLRGLLTKLWNQPIDLIAEGLGSEVVTYEEKHDYILANQDIETAVGIIKEGTIALNHDRHIGITSEGTEII
ncbi:MAG: dihydrodipicolinate reductase, partial [Candidatus Dadabacteria bacterium]